MAVEVLEPRPAETLVLADTEHFTGELADYVHLRTPFDLLTPIANQGVVQQRLWSISPEAFTPQWAGYASTILPYIPHSSQAGPYFELVQRRGERPDDWHFNSFFSTTDRNAVDSLTRDYPKRWHAEEFFNSHQALGWKRAGTMNQNIRYGQMTMALLAQAAIHQLRSRLGNTCSGWDAQHLANAMFRGLDGDLRVLDDKIVVTYYNAPDADILRRHYHHLPAKLQAENVNPRIPWLYDFKLDFRFK